MDFTREPIVETVITPREGYRLAVRSSKNPGTEEHFVDALEVITFGSNCFFRNIERPKSFLLPVSDYEVLEVREPKIVLKNPSIEGAVKIGGGRSEQKSYAPQRESREREKEVREPPVEKREYIKEVSISEESTSIDAESQIDSKSEGSQVSEAARSDRRRDRRRNVRGKTRKGTVREEAVAEELQSPELEVPQLDVQVEPKSKDDSLVAPILAAIIPPPSTLIRDDIARLKANELYKGAFYEREAAVGDEVDDEPVAPFVATPEEAEEENYEDYRARPEPVSHESSGAPAP